MAKQTAANNAVLKRIKPIVNVPIYKLCVKAASEGGDEAIRAVLVRYWKAEAVDRWMTTGDLHAK